MAEVYWIHKKEHTDVFSQGYVGVTSRTAEDRYKQHIKAARVPSSKKSIIHKVINSVGPENLVVETICICEESYAYDLEYKLRPSEYIGWNQNIGGTKPPSAKGKKMKDSTKQKIGAANSGPASERRLLALQKIAENKLGKKRDRDSVEKQKETMKKNGPWKNGAANLKTWSMADCLYENYMEGMTICTASKKYMISTGGLVAIFNYFKNGWVPKEDSMWVEYFKNTESYDEVANGNS